MSVKESTILKSEQRFRLLCKFVMVCTPLRHRHKTEKSVHPFQKISLRKPQMSPSVRPLCKAHMCNYLGQHLSRFQVDKAIHYSIGTSEMHTVDIY